MSAEPAATAPAGEPPERDMTLPQVLEIANRLLRTQHLDEAEALYLQVLEQIPEEPHTLQFLGILRQRQGRTDDALALLERALLKRPGDAGGWINLANVLIETGYHDDAVKALGNAIALAPDAVQAHNNLGILHLRREEWGPAEAALKEAERLAPERDYVHYNLARLYFCCGRVKESAAHSLKTLHLDRHNPKARALLARSLVLQDKRDEAVQLLQQWADEDPDSAEAAHCLAAIGAAATPARASDRYVRTLFDDFADSFEVQLERLGYQGPRLVCDEVARLCARLTVPPRVLDAGCGTGLCGPLLRPLAETLDGVDLSGGMLARARARGDYGALHEAELTAFLEARPLHYDVIASADVLIYFGALDGVLQAAQRALRTGGVLVATLECLDDDARDYALEMHGRYTHCAAYLRRMLAHSGLHLLALERQVLRSEMLETVYGWLFSAVKPARE